MRRQVSLSTYAAFRMAHCRMVADRVLGAANQGDVAGLVAMVRRVAAEEGLRAFFGGLWPLLLRVVPYAALTYAFHRLLFQW